eukprot:CAMPEP_0174325570 /NCGR_PEP_ID=MMETSP0810-20121108/13323_1 /TAXON_ID=73025 ORGANISM="Eutreptiella gymnastica-like, Strain CCMP1594" /NCGR_SAMPLE_ID=MMETSP0810 /ASSEMBLY_ACC=CAM_ASM_000659 /LENGTH=117 /DNA_ID=CAMNT_0015438897 /DNA_START=490 /DNA_END=844 /DNA_ORIENTATION=-
MGPVPWTASPQIPTSGLCLAGPMQPPLGLSGPAAERATSSSSPSTTSTPNAWRASTSPFGNGCTSGSMRGPGVPPGPPKLNGDEMTALKRCAHGPPPNGKRWEEATGTAMQREGPYL